METKKTPTQIADTIQHAGIKGMKWGVRRYQNKDGTLTEAGKHRYNKDTETLSDKEKRKYDKGVNSEEQTQANKWVNEDLRGAKRVADESSSAMNRVTNAIDNNIRSTPKAKLDLSNMSDQELRDAVNRYNLEQQYTNAFAPSNVSKGKVIARNIISGTATAISLAGGALGIAVAIRELMNKGG